MKVVLKKSKLNSDTKLVDYVAEMNAAEVSKINQKAEMLALFLGKKKVNKK